MIYLLMLLNNERIVMNFNQLDFEYSLISDSVIIKNTFDFTGHEEVLQYMNYCFVQEGE